MPNYYFDSKQHAAKIKAGLLKAKQEGKKLGRPKSEKIKGEDIVRDIYTGKIKVYIDHSKTTEIKPTIKQIAFFAMVSKSTVQKIINKYKVEQDKLLQAFLQACETDKLGTLKQILRIGNLLPIYQSQKDIVTWCAFWGSFESLKFLLSRGFRLGKNSKFNAYKIAIERGHEEIAVYLRETYGEEIFKLICFRRE